MTRPILRLSKMLAVLSTVFATPALAMPSYTITPQVADNVFGSPNWSESARVNFDGDRYNLRAGLFRFRLQDEADNTFDLATFCIEITQSLRLPNAYTEADFTPAIAGSVNSLWSNAFGLVVNAQTAAAFQFALWEIVHDNGYHLASGDLRIDGRDPTEALAQSWLDNLADSSWLPNANVAVNALVSQRSQDQLFARLTQDPTPTSVPAPAPGLSVLGAGLLGAAVLRRFRNRSAPDAGGQQG